MSNKLKNATNIYMEGIRDGKVRYAVTTYTGRRYTQHSTGVRDGIEGFVEFFEPFIKRCPVRDIRIVRSIVDGQFVFLQAFQDINNGEAKWLTTDLFDTDAQDKIIEHWDVISAFEDKGSSEHDQINGATEVDDIGKTGENKEAVRDFMREVMVLGNTAELNTYLSLDNYIIHSVQEAISSISSLAGTYEEVFKIIGEGNFVVAYSRMRQRSQEYARFDLFRLKDGLIVEVWINQEPIPPKEQWVNGGKF